MARLRDIEYEKEGADQHLPALRELSRAYSTGEWGGAPAAVCHALRPPQQGDLRGGADCGCRECQAAHAESSNVCQQASLASFLDVYRSFSSVCPHGVCLGRRAPAAAGCLGAEVRAGQQKVARFSLTSHIFQQL